ncbi:cation-transporting P-type ATPase [Nocardioides guangzhouensis]|uniref:Cation-transporting P-type ATPase n=1 Tax=Nocardioides guangzhouensis TaxID=2497878 RepID=A0A4Q4Z6H0_9ACTN|nr:cation-transporting P-type ATPase [Nocardioides guangzhouensis]RYP82691.1 cation-transporting P-type ATPase [Nocardioides guangzhouensis]
MSDARDLLPVGTDGLTTEEAARRLASYGPNRPPPAPRRTLAASIGTQLRDPMILLLLGAGTLTALLHDLPDTVIIAAVVVFNTVTGVVQEVRADRAVAALRDLAPAHTHAWRDGAVVEVAAADVVPGDRLSLAAGDVVPADGEVLEARQLQLDESMMTGEAVPVDRGPGEDLDGGTLVTRGRADVLVTRTGAASGLGRLAALIAASPSPPTPLQRRLSQLSRILVGVVGALTAVVVVIGLAQGRGIAEMAVVGVSLAVAAVPESLPAVVAVALALGAHRMARRNAVVRRLPAVETLGSVTVIASDKTGTLTEGRMVAERLWTPAGEYVVSGHGYDASRGGITALGADGAGPADDPGLPRLLRDGVLCNDALLRGDGPGTTVIGDPLEGALLVVAGKGGLPADGTRDAWPRVSEVPFDHETRRMTTVHRPRDDAGARLTVCKGAPEAVLGLLGGSASAARAATAAERLAAEGYRVLAVADTRDPDGAEVWSLAGLIGIDDPPREHIPAVVEATRRAGIRLLLVTGDHPATANAIARRVGLVGADGEPPPGTVLARVRPEQKVAVVEDLQGDGEVVAMLGDGVNDAPALKRADIGVAAGLGGTQVAREAADLVLLDDNLSTVVAAVEEGRRIFANIRAFLLYAVSGGAAEVGVMVAGPLLGIVQPLLPAQILWINLLTHGLTGVAFGAEPADPSEMSRPPRSASASIFTRTFVRLLALAATLLVVTSLFVGVHASTEPHVQRTAIFLTLGLGQLAVAWAIRARPERRTGVRGLELALVGAAGLLVLGTLVPLLQELLGTATPSPAILAAAVAGAAVPGLVLRWAVGRERRRSR